MDAECLAAEALSGELETLSCAICLASIERFDEASCMSCVCEGVFHIACLARVPVDARCARRCPCCRQRGEILSLDDALHEERALTCRTEVMQLGKLTPENDAMLRRAQRELEQKYADLEEGLVELRMQQGNAGLLPLLFPACRGAARTFCAFAAPWRSFGASTRCQLCHQGILEFSSLATQACKCQALFHATCLSSLLKRTPRDRLVVCARCGCSTVSPECLAVKELLRYGQLRRGWLDESVAGSHRQEAKRRVLQLRKRQQRQLSQLNHQLELVAIKKKCSCAGPGGRSRRSGKRGEM